MRAVPKVTQLERDSVGPKPHSSLFRLCGSPLKDSPPRCESSAPPLGDLSGEGCHGEGSARFQAFPRPPSGWAARR